MNSTDVAGASFSRGQLAQALSLDNRKLFVVALLLAVAPLWFGTYVPLVDLPQHAGQITALREMYAGDAAFTRAFELNWFTPYLLGYLVLYVLSFLAPITVATQIVASLSIVSVPVLTGRLLRAVGADTRWRWLAIPGAYGFAFYWGFLPFFTAVPVAILFLIQTIRFVDEPSRRRGVGIALFSVFLFFSHVIAVGFASLVALGYVVGRTGFNVRQLLLRMLPYAAVLPIIALWMASTYNTSSNVPDDPIIYDSLANRLMFLATQPSGRETFSPFITPLVTSAIILLPLLSGCRLSRRPERWLPLVLGIVAFMATPHYVFSAAYFYQRLGIFLVPLWLFALEPTHTRHRNLDWLAILIVLIWALTNAGRFAAFARESESYTEATRSIEPRQRVAAMIHEKWTPLFAFPVYMHFPAWYQAEQRGILDFNFADFYSQVARYRTDAGPRIKESTTWQPTTFTWEANGGAIYDYFVVRSRFDISNEIFKEKRGSVELVTRSGWWWVYRNTERVQQGSSRRTGG